MPFGAPDIRACAEQIKKGAPRTTRPHSNPIQPHRAGALPCYACLATPSQADGIFRLGQEQARQLHARTGITVPWVIHDRRRTIATRYCRTGVGFARLSIRAWPHGLQGWRGRDLQPGEYATKMGRSRTCA